MTIPSYAKASCLHCISADPPKKQAGRQAAGGRFSAFLPTFLRQALQKTGGQAGGKRCSVNSTHAFLDLALLLANNNLG